MVRIKQTARKSTGGKSVINFTPPPQQPKQRRIAQRQTGIKHSSHPVKKLAKLSLRKPQRYRYGVEQEIRALQRSTDLLIPRLPFSRLVREITATIYTDFRWRRTSMEALQEATESYLTQMFEDAYQCTTHCKRVTLMDRDLRLVQRLRGSPNATYY